MFVWSCALLVECGVKGGCQNWTQFKSIVAMAKFDLERGRTFHERYKMLISWAESSQSRKYRRFIWPSLIAPCVPTCRSQLPCHHYQGLHPSKTQRETAQRMKIPLHSTFSDTSSSCARVAEARPRGSARHLGTSPCKSQLSHRSRSGGDPILACLCTSIPPIALKELTGARV